MARQRGKRWEGYVCWRGQRFRRAAETQQEAELWEAETRANLLAGRPVDAPQSAGGGPTTLRALYDQTFERYWRGSRAEATAEKNGRLVLEILGDTTPPRRVDASALDRLIQTLKDQRNANGTINRKLAVISKMLRHAHSRGWIDRVPAIERLPESGGRLRWFTWEEEVEIVGRAKFLGYTDLADLVVFLVDTGMRLSEGLRLEYRDVDFSNGHVRVWITKADKPRSVPMTRRVSDVLAARKLRIAGTPDCPFGKLTKDIAEHQWTRVRVSLGMDTDKQWVLHTLRHTCASRLVQGNVPIQVVQQWLGHKTLQMTLRYAHLAQNNLASARSALEAGHIVPSGSHTPLAVA